MVSSIFLMIWIGGAFVRKDNWRQEMFWPYYLGQYLSTHFTARKDTPDAD